MYEEIKKAIKPIVKDEKLYKKIKAELKKVLSTGYAVDIKLLKELFSEKPVDIFEFAKKKLGSDAKALAFISDVIDAYSVKNTILYDTSKKTPKPDMKWFAKEISKKHKSILEKLLEEGEIKELLN